MGQRTWLKPCYHLCSTFTTWYKPRLALESHCLPTSPPHCVSILAPLNPGQAVGFSGQRCTFAAACISEHTRVRYPNTVLYAAGCRALSASFAICWTQGARTRVLGIHWMVWVGRDLQRPSGPTPLHWTGTSSPGSGWLVPGQLATGSVSPCSALRSRCPRSQHVPGCERHRWGASSTGEEHLPPLPEAGKGQPLARAQVGSHRQQPFKSPWYGC